MELNLQHRSRATLVQLLTLLLALKAIHGMRNSSTFKPRNNNSSSEGGFNRHIRNCDGQFKTFSNTTVRILPRHSNLFARAAVNEDNADDLMVEVNAFGSLLQLELKPNKYLIHPNYTEKTITVSGQVEYLDDANYANSTATPCYYIGHVLNHDGSTAAAVTCDGFRAQIFVSGELYHVEPIDGTWHGRHRVYRQSDSLLPESSCGGDPSGGGHNITRIMEYLKTMGKQIRKKRDTATLNWPNDLQGVTRVVELYVANDYSQYVNLGSNATATFTRTKEIINFVSSLYQPLQVYISLVGVEVWTTGSLITITPTDAKATLGNFTQYRVNSINPYHKNDNAQLLAYVRYPLGVIGLAWVDRMCAADQSSAIVSDISAVSGFTAAVSAHEMGHNFGMRHDDQLAPVYCACDDPTGICIMQSFAQLPAASRWSNCSSSVMSSFLSSSSSSCLNDFNGVLYDATPLCGNGIVESGEQCDCGNAPLTDCNANCCNKTTCTIIAPAICVTGRCCNIATCQLKPLTTLCRAANSPCDLAEYCSGVDSTCPSDVYKHDGTICTVNGVSVRKACRTNIYGSCACGCGQEQAYCYTGSCQTRSTQCKLWWGPSTMESASVCYTTYNTQGVEYGNCGYDQTAGAYVPCSVSDTLCGSLKCDVNSTFNPTIKIIGTIKWYHVSLSGNNCKMPVAPINYAIPNLDLTPDGAACGTNSMCLNHHCVSVASVLNQTFCSCSQHGVCNNLNQCHCDIGYGPPDCSQPGDGGSYHSNQITLTTTSTVMSSVGTTGSLLTTTSSSLGVTSAPPIVTTTLPVTTTQPVTTTVKTSAASTTVPVVTTPVATTILPASTPAAVVTTTSLPATTTQPVTTTVKTSAASTTVPVVTTPVATTILPASTPAAVVTTTSLPATTTQPVTTTVKTSAASTTVPVVTTPVATTILPASTPAAVVTTTSLPATTTQPVTTTVKTSAASTTVPVVTTPVATTILPASTPAAVVTTTSLPATTTQPVTTTVKTSAASTTVPVVTTPVATTILPVSTPVTVTSTRISTSQSVVTAAVNPESTKAGATTPQIGRTETSTRSVLTTAGNSVGVATTTVTSFAVGATSIENSQTTKQSVLPASVTSGRTSTVTLSTSTTRRPKVPQCRWIRLKSRKVKLCAWTPRSKKDKILNLLAKLRKRMQRKG